MGAGVASGSGSRGASASIGQLMGIGPILGCHARFESRGHVEVGPHVHGLLLRPKQDSCHLSTGQCPSSADRVIGFWRCGTDGPEAGCVLHGIAGETGMQMVRAVR